MRHSNLCGPLRLLQPLCPFYRNLTLVISFALLVTSARANSFFESEYLKCFFAGTPSNGHEGECDGLPTYGTPGGTIYSFQLPNPLPGSFKIEGKLVITSSNVWSGLNVRMGNAAEIYLNPLVALSLTGNTVIEGCETMWKGVTLDLYSTLNVSGYSEINDAVNAIYVTKRCTVNLYDSKFRRNYRTLFALSPNLNNISFSLYAAGATVIGTGPLKPPHSQQSYWDYGTKAETGFRFIRCSNVGGNLKVGEIGDPQCTFRDCTYGVNAYESNLVVENCRFEEMTGGSYFGFYFGGIGIYGEYGYYKIQRCEFYHCFGGISLYKMNFLVDQNDFSYLTQALYSRQSIFSGNPPTVEDNTVDFVNYGFIFFQNDDSSPVIHDNTMTRIGKDAISIMDFPGLPNTSYVHTNTITLSGGGWPNAISDGNGVGVRLTTTRNAAVCRNNITHSPDGEEAICIVADGSHLATITNNDLMLDEQGATYLGAHTGIRYSMTTNSTLDCNRFTGNTYGLIVNGVSTLTKVSKNTFIKDLLQGMVYNMATTQVQTHTGNRWGYTTNGSYPGAVNNGSDPAANRFYVDCNEDAQLCPFVVSAPGWFVPQSTPGNTPVCNPGGNICSVPPPFAPDDDDEEMIGKIINNELTFTDYAAPSAWLASRQALSWLAVNGETTSTEYNDYWTEMSNTSQGKLAQLEADAIAWQTTHASQKQQMNTLWSEMLALLEGTDQSEIAQDLFESKRRQFVALRDAREADYAQMLSDWAQTNAELPETEAHVYNQKRLNALLLDLRTRNPITFTPSEQTMLDEVAGQCLYEGGPAVLQARYLISLKSETTWDDEYLCSDRGQEAKAGSLPPGDLQVIPNPNTGSFRILMPAGAPAEGAQALLYDMTGRLLRRQNLRSGNERFDTTGEVPPGLYMLEVRDASDRRIGLTKVNIQ